MTGDRHADALGPHLAARRRDTAAASAFDDEALDLAILDDVDAEPTRGTRIAPGHRIVTRGAGPSLPYAAKHRKTRIRREIADRCYPPHLFERVEFGIDAVDLHRIHGARGDLHLIGAVAERDHAALRQHDIVVEVLRQPLIEAMRQPVERDAFRIVVVGAHHRGVAAGIAAADPALLEEGDIADPVRLG